MKKFFHFLTVGFIALSITSCLNVKQPEVKQIEGVKILSMNDSLANVAVDLRVHNPNNMKIQVKSCNLDAYLNKKYVGKVNIPNQLVIAKNSDDVHTVVLQADLTKVKKLIPSLIFANKALLNLQGNLEVKAIGIKKKLEVNFDQKISRKDLLNLNIASTKL